LSDLVLPAGVQLVALAHGKDLPVANIHASRVVKDAE
jgi:large subunit ribosomal protein L25